MDIELPRLADTLVEGTVARWLKRPGDPVRRGEPLVEIETDKVNSELEAPADGVLAEVLAAEGETVPVGTVIARMAAGPGDVVRGETSRTAAAPQPPAVARPARAERLAEHLRRSAETVPQGACVREVTSDAAQRLGEAVAAVSRPGLQVDVAAPSSSQLVMPSLEPGQAALVAAGAEQDGRRLLTLCYDRRALDDWAADRLLKEIAQRASG